MRHTYQNPAGPFGLDLNLTLLIVGFILILIGLTWKKKPKITSHWHQLVLGLKMSVDDFYNGVDAVIERRQVPGAKLWVKKYHEGGIFSAKRLYLRIARRDHVFDICAAPFGEDFFISWWLAERMHPVAVAVNFIPILGPVLNRAFRTETFYRIDTALMFQDSVHSAVLEVLDQRMKGQGLRLLSESERKPIMRELFKQRR